MTEFELFQALRPFYPVREYALLPQVANATGFGANRHADAIALSLWPSRGLTLAGFEMKSYRGDWIRELRKPEKAEEVAQYCNYWWIVAAGPLVKPDELPPAWGLMTWDAEKKALVKTKHAPLREAVKPDLPFIAGILRKAQDVITPDGVIEQARKDGYEEGLNVNQSRQKWELEEYAKLKAKVAEFEKASGVKITGRWESGEDIGTAVNQVLNGTVMRERNSLRTAAKRILEDLGSTEEL